MSRNKAILLIGMWIGVLFLIPSTSDGLYIKEMMLRLSAYFLILVVVYLAITMHLLRKSFKRLIQMPNDENTLRAAKLLGFTFDVKRGFGVGTLQSVYDQANRSKGVSMEAKEEIYQALRRKKIDIPPPSMGKRT